MNKRITRLLSLLLALCVLLSLASCRRQEKEPAGKQPDTSSVIEDQGTEDTSSTPDDVSEITDALDGELEDGWSEDSGYEDMGDIDNTDSIGIINRPETDNAISVGIKLAYAGDDLDDELDDELDSELDDEEDWEIDTDISIDEVDISKVIEPYGTLKTNGKKRAININNSKEGILFTNFSGLSTNVYPTQGMLMSQQNTGDREAFVEINGDRFNNIKASFARTWFQIDWMMTDECAEKGLNYRDFATNWEKNPDYNNYYNGIYNFEGEQMQSCIDYWSMLEEAGTEIYLAFGWKIATRIQNWFSSDMRYPRESAPRDLDAYADAAVALYKYVREDVGLTNFNILSFYNEPNWNAPGEITYQDFSVTGDKRVWWVNMVKKCREAFDKNGLKDVIIACADHTGTIMTNDDKMVSVYVKNHIPELVDMWSFHIYPGRGWMLPNGYDGQYEILCDAMRYIFNLYGESSYLTEYYGTVLHDEGSEYRWSLHGWDTSNAAFLIAAANNGVRGNFHWGFTGGYLCDPLMFDPANGSSAAWLVPKSNSLDAVQHGFYECSLMNNYIPKNANVHNIEWAGDDIRASAFTSPDGKDFSLIVEADENSTQKEIEVSLSQSLAGRDINVFCYDFNTKYTSNAIIPTLYDTIKNVNRSFTYDEIDGDYGVYIFTTLAPVKQIALFNPADSSKDAIYNEVATDGTVSIKPDFIDFNGTPSKDNVIWEIKRYSCAPTTDNATGMQNKSVSLEKTSDDLGELTVAADGTVTYKPRSGAKAGDIIAVRCTLKSDKDVWTSAIIEIKNS